MKLLVITSAFPPQPAAEAEHAFHICRGLSARGMEIEVLTGENNGAGLAARFPVHAVMPGWAWRNLPRLALALHLRAPDVVLLMHTGWTYGMHPMVTFVPTVARAVLPRAAVVTLFTHDDGSHPLGHGLASRACRKAVALWAGSGQASYRFGTLFRDSDRIVVLSDFYRRSLAEEWHDDSGKVVVIPPPPLLHLSPENNGATRQHFRDRLGVADGEFLFAFFGHIYPGKGVESLLRAFHRVARQKQHTRLLLIGGGDGLAAHAAYRNEIDDLARGLGLAGRLLSTGRYASDSDDASGYLRAADACVLPFTEGAHVHRSSLVAAAVHGLPLVTTHGAVPDRFLRHEENVLLCSPGDEAEIVGQMTRLAEDAGLRERLRAGVVRLAAEEFTADRVINRLAALLVSARRDCYPAQLPRGVGGLFAVDEP